MAIELLERAVAATTERETREALESARRAAGGAIWVHRNIARIYRERLGDVAAGRAVLEELEPLICAEWRLVAAAWCELGDRERASACLEHAANNARTVADQCTLALGYRDAEFADEGRLLVEGAESIATRALDFWIVANAHDAFSARDRGIEVLERGLRDAVEVGELVSLAHAFSAYDAEVERLADILERATHMASTVDGWLQLAIAYDQLALDRDTATACLRAANDLSISGIHDRAIGLARARLGGLELLDDERPTLLPGQLLHPGARCFDWGRDPARLLGWVRSRLLRSYLDALAPPGQFYAGDDLRTLLEIQRTGAIPHPLPAFLDGLRQVRWGAGPGSDPITRAFACTLLCLDDASVASVPPAPAGGNEVTMALLLETCLELGPGAVEGAIALFAAMADAYDATRTTTRTGHHVVFAELGLVLAAAWLDPTDPRIDGVLARIERDEPVYRDRGDYPSPRWVLGLAPGAEVWTRVAARALIHPRHAALRARLTTG